jgi:hypothetical protein
MLGELTSKGEHKSQKILDTSTLLGCDEGEFKKNVRLTKKYPVC